MRVLLVTNGLRYGGAERIVEALAIDLTARGDAVSVIATTRGGPIKDTLRARNIPVSVLSIRTAIDGRVPLKLARVARRFSPDVIHSHLAVADIATAAAARLIGRPRLVTTVHNPGVELDWLKKSLWKIALSRFDQVMAVSEGVRESLSPSLEPVVVRPSLIEMAAKPQSRGEARATLGIANDIPLVLAVGRLAPVKGFDVLRDAIPHLETRGVRVLVIGEGDSRAELEGSRLELLGARNDAAALLPAADVVVCPSRSEGFPQLPLQAMAAARPVVATRVGGTPEVVVHGETGTLVPPDDPRALARAIDAVLGDPALATRLGEAGHRRIANEGFSRSAMVDRIRAIYANSDA